MSKRKKPKAPTVGDIFLFLLTNKLGKWTQEEMLEAIKKGMKEKENGAGD